MTIDIFGRTSHKTNDVQYNKGIPGAPGVGFKLTSDGQFDLDGKRLCNVTEAIAENDVVTLSCLRSIVNRELNILKQAIKQNEKRIIDQKSIILKANEENNEKTIISITVVENIIRDLVAEVETLNNIINNQQSKLDKLDSRISNVVKSLLRDEEMIKEIKQKYQSFLKNNGK